MISLGLEVNPSRAKERIVSRPRTFFPEHRSQLINGINLMKSMAVVIEVKITFE